MRAAEKRLGFSALTVMCLTLGIGTTTCFGRSRWCTDLLLGAVGLYVVMSYSVSQGARELAIH